MPLPVKSFSYRRIQLIVYWVFFILTLTALWRIYLFYHLSPVSIVQPVKIEANGSALQAGKRVGRFLPGPNNQATLALPIPSFASEGLFSLQIPVSLSQKLTRVPLTVNFVSIQSTANMSYTSTGPGALTLNLGVLLPDSHTVVYITAPTSAVSIPFDIRVINSLTSLPFVDWLYLSFGLVLVTGLTVSWLGRPIRITTQSKLKTPPDKLTALEVAVLTIGSVESTMVAAEIFELASRGHLEIVQGQERTTLFAHLATNDPVQPYEEKLLEIILPTQDRISNFQFTISSLQRTFFSNTVGEMYIKVYYQLYERGYFSEDLRSLHLRYKTLGIFIQLTALILSSIAYLNPSQATSGLVSFGVALYLAGVMVYQLHSHLHPLTAKGKQTYQDAMAFKNYLSSSELIGPEDEEGKLFYRYLPYALIFECYKAWYRRFDRTMFMSPDWYTNAGDAIADPAVLVGEVESLVNNLSEAIVGVKDPNVD